jgi:hypothetical protein
VQFDSTLNELLAAYLEHAIVYYRKNGEATGEVDNIRLAFRPLRRLVGETLIREFTPLRRKAERDSMIQAGLSRTTINARVGRIKRCFKWGTGECLVPDNVYGSVVFRSVQFRLSKLVP